MPTLTIIVGGPDVYERLSRYKGYLSEGMLDYLILKEGEKNIGTSKKPESFAEELSARQFSEGYSIPR